MLLDTIDGGVGSYKVVFTVFSKVSVDASNLYLISCILAKNLSGDCRKACFCHYKNIFFNKS